LIKKFGLICLLLAGCLMLHGCGSFFIVRADKLLAAPAASALQLEIIRDFEQSHKQAYTLHAPVYGKYVSSFLMRDIDADSNEEAVFFYQTNSGNKNICCCVMDKNDGKWAPTADIEGPAGQVYDVAFTDMNQDALEEIIIGWYFVNFNGNKLLTINGRTPEDKRYYVLATEPYSEKIVDDIDKDGNDDVFLVASDFSSVSSRAYAKLLKMETASMVKLVSQARLDSKASSYSGLKSDKATDASPLRVYIDTVKGENQMITDVVYWDAGTKSLISALIDSETLSNSVAPRPANIPSLDINNDGVIEIPYQETKPLRGGGVYITKGEQAAPFYMIGWLALQKNNTTQTVLRTAYNTDEGYFMEYPPLQDGKAAVISYIYDRRWDVVSVDDDSGKAKILFSIKVFGADQWPSGKNRNGPYRGLFTTPLGTAGVSITPQGAAQGLSYSNISGYFGISAKGDQ